MDHCQYVNVFQGCGATALPDAQPPASSWHFIKAICGNTLPAATLPFGKYSCCMYTTGYPTGYGCHYLNCNPRELKSFREGTRYHGLSHFHQSGTGMIDYYYNFAVTTAYYGVLPSPDGYALKTEDAVPGYYTVTTDNGIVNETTVNKNAVFHRFSFPAPDGKIALDFTNNGLYKENRELYFRPVNGTIRLVAPNKVTAQIDHNGLTHYFVYTLTGATAVGLFKNGKILSGTDQVSFSKTKSIYGVVFQATQSTVTARLTSSFLSAEHAEALSVADSDSFEQARQAAYRTWDDALSRIEIETDDKREAEIFYSDLYHSLVKPSDRSGESPFSGGAFTVDYATMWDIYKTQLPLVFTLYPEISEKIMHTFTEVGTATGKLPHTFVMKDGFHEPSRQACMLAEYSVCDAYYRGVKADYRTLLRAMQQDMERKDYAALYTDKLPERLTHLLDASEAAKAVCALARELNAEPDEKLLRLSKKQAACFDEKTGLLKADHDYYEGNVWNYSFRLMHDMDERIRLAGGKERFTALLDRFFGFTDEKDTTARFEGFNNEPDMEAPFSYLFAGRADRLCDISAAMRQYMFTTGRGGLPGNNDSGGLSSCYLWYCLGIFPVTGQNRMLAGSPAFKKAVLHLQNGKVFTIRKQGNGLYVQSITLNGRELSFPSFSVSDMMNGGEIVFQF